MDIAFLPHCKIQSPSLTVWDWKKNTHNNCAHTFSQQYNKNLPTHLMYLTSCNIYWLPLGEAVWSAFPWTGILCIEYGMQV